MVSVDQNDGGDDPKGYYVAYITFIRQIRGHYSKVQIVCLTSPMADILFGTIDETRTYSEQTVNERP